MNLALEVRRPCGPDYVPSPLWQSRCGGGVLKLSTGHDDFPTLLAEALDVLAALDADPKRAAAVLSCTPSQLIRLLKLDPRALALVNGWRRHARCTLFDSEIDFLAFAPAYAALAEKLADAVPGAPRRSAAAPWPGPSAFRSTSGPGFP